MKWLVLLLTISFTALAQDVNTQLKLFESKIYSAKTKGIKELVFDIVSENLTKQLNDEMIYGHLNEVRFRVYWTQSPERISMEVLGMPEGFNEIKEQLKMRVASQLEVIFPVSLNQKFNGYKFSLGKMPTEIIAQDSTGIAVIPKFTLNFDNQNRLLSVIGHKHLGKFSTAYNYERESFSDGRWVLKGETTQSSEAGIEVSTAKKYSYGSVNGVQLPKAVTIETTQTMNDQSKLLKTQDLIKFEAFKLNSGEALKFFLSEQKDKAK